MQGFSLQRRKMKGSTPKLSRGRFGASWALNSTVKRADIDGNDRIANLSGELTELRAEVARLRAERLDRASEDVAETSRHSSDPLSPCTG